MALSSGGIAQFSSGAGRSYQNTIPASNDTTTGGTGVGSNQDVRTGNSLNGVSSSSAATGSVQYQDYKVGNPGAVVANGNSTDGSVCVRLFNGAAGDQAKYAFNQGIANKFDVEQLDPGIAPDRLFRVRRFIVRAAFPTLGGALNLLTADCGLCIVPGNTASMNIGGNRPGMQIGPTDVNKFSIRTRKSFAAAYDYQQDFTFAQLGVTKLDTWITYEIRLIGADNTGPAKVKFFFNEVQIGATLSMGPADGRVPGMTSSGGGFLGLVPFCINGNTGIYSWYVQYMSLIMTADEQGNI